MKATTSYALVWLGISTVITTAILYTGNLNALWAFIFPLFITMKDDDND